MSARGRVVRLSSKGQIVIPAAVRRALGLKAGQPLTVRTTGARDIVFSVDDAGAGDLTAWLRRAHAWTRRSRRDLVEELHERRRQERAREVSGRGRRSH